MEEILTTKDYVLILLLQGNGIPVWDHTPITMQTLLSPLELDTPMRPEASAPWAAVNSTFPREGEEIFRWFLSELSIVSKHFWRWLSQNEKKAFV